MARTRRISGNHYRQSPIRAISLGSQASGPHCVVRNETPVESQHEPAQEHRYVHRCAKISVVPPHAVQIDSQYLV